MKIDRAYESHGYRVPVLDTSEVGPYVLPESWNLAIILTMGMSLIDETAASVRPNDLFSSLNAELRNLVVQEKNGPYDVVDFFSGCGGMSYGFHKVGEETGLFRLIGAIDNNQYANQTYEQNLGTTPATFDLAKIDVDGIKEYLRLGGRDEEKPLIVVGCAPCQGFSSHRKKDPRRDVRNSLVGRFGELAVSLGAEMIVMENVPDLLSTKHWNHFDAFKNIVEANGYKLAVSIVNMAEFGVPQERFRAVVLASKSIQPTLPNSRLPSNNFRTVRDAIGSLPPLVAGEASQDDPMHVTSKHRKETVELISKVPKDGGSRPRGIGPKCLDNVSGFYDVYGRLAWDKPAVTITARCRTPSCGRFIHPEQNRGLSVREAGLLQGFPSDFVFEGPFDDKFKQIGNAVPPLFSLRFAIHVLELLSGKQSGFTKGVQIDSPQFHSFSGAIARIKANRKSQTA